MKTSILMEMSTIFYLLNRTIRQPQYQKEFLADVEKLDLYSNENAKYLFYRFNDYIKTSGGKKKLSSIP